VNDYVSLEQSRQRVEGAMKLLAWFENLLRCHALSRKKQRCYRALFHRGRHRYRPLVPIVLPPITATQILAEKSARRAKLLGVEISTTEIPK
jgi:hypothetical protein